MREIKFRAWTRKGMVTPAVWVNDESLPCYSLSGAPLKPLMQYTGLTDKNGVEIYEGDIVTNNYILWRIEFGDEGSFIACALDNEFNYALLSDYVFEVVGNIYEHGHLLDSN